MEIQGKEYRSAVNQEQRHFPMLREYEKAKFTQIINSDLDGGDSQEHLASGDQAF